MLAYYTKQSALVVVLTLAAGSLLASRGKSWPQWLFTFGLGISVFLVWNWQSQGWFSFYTFETITNHQFYTGWLNFVITIARKYVVAWLLCAVFAAWVLWRIRSYGWRTLGAALPPLSLAAGLMAARMSVFIKIWTYDNGYLPACLGASILAGWGLRVVFQQPQNHVNRWLPAAQLLVGVLLLYQFCTCSDRKLPPA